MSVLDQVIQLKNQGVSDEEIIQSLREQGVPPRAIGDALNQAQIKAAVSSFESYGNEGEIPSIMQEQYPGYQEGQGGQQPYPQGQYPEYPQYQQGQEEMQQQYPPQEAPNTYTPQPQQEFQQPAQQEGYDYSQPESAGGYESYPSSGGYDSETIIEISEQVFLEKSEEIKKQVAELVEFKTIAETKIDYISSSLKRIESVIDKLQLSILEKVGSYGRNLESIKKEMEMVEDSFSKVIGHSSRKGKK